MQVPFAVRHGRWFVTGVAAATAALSLAACGSNSDSSTSAAPGSSAGSAGGTCSGAPLKMTTIFSQSGRLAVFGTDVPDAVAAAVAAVNKTCDAGRPLDVTVCDDQSTPNGALTCGRA